MHHPRGVSSSLLPSTTATVPLLLALEHVSQEKSINRSTGQLMRPGSVAVGFAMDM